MRNLISLIMIVLGWVLTHQLFVSFKPEWNLFFVLLASAILSLPFLGFYFYEGMNTKAFAFCSIFVAISLFFTAIGGLGAGALFLIFAFRPVIAINNQRAVAKS